MEAAVPQSGIAPPERLLPVHVASIDPQVVDLDLWLRHDSQTQPTLYRSAGLEISREDLDRLHSSGIEFLHVPAAQHAKYRTLLLDKLDTTFKTGDAQPAQRAVAVRKACTRMIEEVLILPGVGESVETVVEVARVASGWLDSDPESFSYLLDMSAHDFYTATHMVNVGMGCALLCKQLRPNDQRLIECVTQGGFLHDVGKRSIPLNILNKEGKLTDEEFAIIKGHPTLGLRELRNYAGLDPIVLEMTNAHHERLDGKGYPDGKRAEEIGFAARICAVVDVFDALVAARPYRGPTHPRDVLLSMAKGAGTQFDPEVFFTWEGLVTGLLLKDPARAQGTTEGATSPSLAQIAGARNAADLAEQSATTGCARVLDSKFNTAEPLQFTVVSISPGRATLRFQKDLPTGEAILIVFDGRTAAGAACRAVVESLTVEGEDRVVQVAFQKAAAKRAA